MFFVIILAVWAAMHVYAFWRLASIPLIAAHVPHWGLAVIALCLWAGLLASRFAERFGLPTLAEVLEFVGANWIGMLFLLVACLFAVDVVTGFGYLAPRMTPQLRTWALIAAGVLSIIAFVQGSRTPVVHSYEVEIRGLPPEKDGTVLVVASDLHVGGYRDGRWVSARVDQINAQRPDLVVLAGDIVEGDGDGEVNTLKAFGRLTAPLGVWAVNGNHETYGPNGANGAALEHAGFHVLHDQWVELSPGFVIAGVDDLTTRRRRLGHYAEFVDRALAGRPAAAATIFLSHSPLAPERAAAQGVGLMLSGHTHGGQIWPFGYVVKWFYPLLAGRYNVNGMTAIVCRGTGTWGPQMRLWSRGELLRIVLRTPTTAAGPRRF